MEKIGYHFGDKGVFTGWTAPLHGRDFYEIKLVEGHLKDKTFLVARLYEENKEGRMVLCRK